MTPRARSGRAAAATTSYRRSSITSSSTEPSGYRTSTPRSVGTKPRTSPTAPAVVPGPITHVEAGSSPLTRLRAIARPTASGAFDGEIVLAPWSGSRERGTRRTPTTPVVPPTPTSSTSAGEEGARPAANSARRRPAASGERAKTSECIFTPDGTPMQGTASATASARSVAVPSPPAKTMTSTPSASSRLAAAIVSSRVVRGSGNGPESTECLTPASTSAVAPRSPGAATRSTWPSASLALPRARISRRAARPSATASSKRSGGSASVPWSASLPPKPEIGFISTPTRTPTTLLAAQRFDGVVETRPHTRDHALELVGRGDERRRERDRVGGGEGTGDHALLERSACHGCRERALRGEGAEWVARLDELDGGHETPTADLCDVRVVREGVVQQLVEQAAVLGDWVDESVTLDDVEVG